MLLFLQKSQDIIFISQASDGFLISLSKRKKMEMKRSGLHWTMRVVYLIKTAVGKNRNKQ